MKLWVLTYGYDYESDDVVGVFSSEDKALSAAKDLNLGSSKHYDITPCVLDEMESEK